MSLLSKASYFAKKLQGLGSCDFILESRLIEEMCYFSRFGVSHYRVFLYESIIFKKTLRNDIKIFNLHYSIFTPKLRFIYSVKRLFAYCFDKAPTLYLVRAQILRKIMQALREMALVHFCCANRLEGGVIC